MRRVGDENENSFISKVLSHNKITEISHKKGLQIIYSFDTSTSNLWNTGAKCIYFLRQIWNVVNDSMKPGGTAFQEIGFFIPNKYSVCWRRNSIQSVILRNLCLKIIYAECHTLKHHFCIKQYVVHNKLYTYTCIVFNSVMVSIILAVFFNPLKFNCFCRIWGSKWYKVVWIPGPSFCK